MKKELSWFIGDGGQPISVPGMMAWTLFSGYSTAPTRDGRALIVKAVGANLFACYGDEQS